MLVLITSTQLTTLMTTTYLFDKGNRMNAMSMQRQAISIIQSFFAKYSTLVGKPVFTLSPDKVIVQLFYYAPNDAVTNASMAALGNALTRCFGRIVEIRLIRLNHSALDSSIFAQYLTANGGKYAFNRILDMLKGNLPTVVSEGSVDKSSKSSLLPTSHITGIKVKLSGRLTTQRSSPRQTVQAGRLGSSAKGSYGTVDYSQHTAKNKLGSFTMKV